MSGAVLRNFQVSIFDCRSFLSGDDPGTNRKSGFELVPLTLAQMKFQPNKIRAWRDSNPQPSDPKSEALSG